eukprot:828466-Pyramimonas_sp.AAC.1
MATLRALSTRIKCAAIRLHPLTSPAGRVTTVARPTRKSVRLRARLSILSRVSDRRHVLITLTVSGRRTASVAM